MKEFQGIDLIYFLTVSGKTTEAYKLECEYSKQGIVFDDGVSGIRNAYNAGWEIRKNKSDYIVPRWATQTVMLENAFAKGYMDYKNFRE